MNKRDLDMLERAFTAEIGSRLPFQTKSKRAQRLADEGYLQPLVLTFGGRFPVKVTGWELTHAGRLAYCMTC